MMAVGEIAQGAREKKSGQSQDDRSAATREKLMDGAYRVMLELGHAGLRSANISSAAGVSRGGLLHHYPTKEMLIAAVYERIVDRMEADTLDRIASSEHGSVLEAIVADARERFFGEAYRVMLDILIASGEEEPVAAVLRTLEERERKPAHLCWAERLEETGAPRDLAVKVASFLWYLVKGLAVRSLVYRDEVHDRRVIALGLSVADKRIAASRPG